MSLGLGYEVSSLSGSSSSNSISAQILKNVFPDVASSTTWWDSIATNNGEEQQNDDNQNDNDRISRLSNTIQSSLSKSSSNNNAASSSMTSISHTSSTSSTFYDPRFLLPLIHTVLAVKQHQLKDPANSKIKVANFYANRVMPVLVRALSSTDRTLRDIAFDSLALCYQGLQPTRRLFVDSIVLAMV